MAERKQIPMAADLLRLTDSVKQKGQLIGTMCNSCGETFFGKKTICENCQSADLKEHILSNKGKLWSFTVVHFPPPPPYKSPNPFVPYGGGWVELSDGILIISLLTENDPTKLSTGMELEMIVDKLYEDEAGNDIMIYKFKPIASSK
jgi:uncharacterized OB-fold protein